ncbi:MAG: sodium:solute symporter family protein [Planctomycetes bacterium]|nr:sodium:solute symporter family protein [Planctomycetota bacterium]
MSYYVWIILAYLLVLLGFNFWRSFKVKSQEDFMVAGRSLSMPVLVFTLVCTWIGSGTFIAGAEFAYQAGFSALWMAAGAWAGIVVIYFLAARVRTFGQYTIGDILEVRYGPLARLLGALALIVSFTAIVSYQFRAGGLILNMITRGAENRSVLTLASGERVSVQDLREYQASAIVKQDGSRVEAFNLMTDQAAGVHRFYDEAGEERTVPLSAALRVEAGKGVYLHRLADGSVARLAAADIVDKEFEGTISRNKGAVIAAIFVILFTALAGMMAVAHTDLFNGIIILVACVVAVPFVVANAGGMEEAVKVLPAGHFQVINDAYGSYPVLKAGSYFLATLLLLLGVQSMYQKFYAARTPREAKNAVAWWVLGTILVETIVVVIAVFAAAKFYSRGYDPATMVLVAARYMVPTAVGILLLGAACVVVLSTAMNYLLSPTTNIMRDIYQRFINPSASSRAMIGLQKTMIVLLGIVALLIGIALESVLEQAFFAYTIYGVAITPALLAALTWKRATKAGGLASIVAGTVVCVGLKLFSAFGPEDMNPEGDPFGIPLIYPSFAASLLALVLVSYLTPPPSKEVLEKVFNPKLQTSE